MTETGSSGEMLPFFSPERVEAWRPHVQQICDELIDGFADRVTAWAEGAIRGPRAVPVTAERSN